jgi:hypothetical protein
LPDVVLLLAADPPGSYEPLAAPVPPVEPDALPVLLAPPVPVVVDAVFWPWPPLRLARQLLNSSANLR